MMRKQAYQFKSNSPVGSNKIKEPQLFVNLSSYIRYKNSNVLLGHWAKYVYPYCLARLCFPSP